MTPERPVSTCVQAIGNGICNTWGGGAFRLYMGLCIRLSYEKKLRQGLLLGSGRGGGLENWILKSEEPQKRLRRRSLLPYIPFTVNKTLPSVAKLAIPVLSIYQRCGVHVVDS